MAERRKNEISYRYFTVNINNQLYIVDTLPTNKLYCLRTLKLLIGNVKITKIESEDLFEIIKQAKTSNTSKYAELIAGATIFGVSMLRGQDIRINEYWFILINIICLSLLFIGINQAYKKIEYSNSVQASINSKIRIKSDLSFLKKLLIILSPFCGFLLFGVYIYLLFINIGAGYIELKNIMWLLCLLFISLFLIFFVFNEEYYVIEMEKEEIVQDSSI